MKNLVFVVMVLVMAGCATTPVPRMKQQGFPCDNADGNPFDFKSIKCHWSEEKQDCECISAKEKVTAWGVGKLVLLGTAATTVWIAAEFARSKLVNSGVKGPID